MSPQTRVLLIILGHTTAVFCLPGFLTLDREDPDVNRTIVEIIKSRGFRVEVHKVNTEDGYILTMQRIVNPYYRGNPRPVLLQHGIFSSAYDFIINSAGGNLRPGHNKDVCDFVPPMNRTGNNLGFVLSKHGFDVWLGNSRGAPSSRGHVKLDSKSREYWQFSFDQMIEYDLPAVIRYILHTTEQKTLGYIGHSQGTMIMFGLLSKQPKYAQIVKPFIALAPIVSFWYMKSPIKYLAATPLMEVLRETGGPFLPSQSLPVYLTQTFCQSSTRFVCTNMLLFASGFDPAEIDASRMAVLMSHVTESTSNWNMAHFLQLARAKVLTQFDHGVGKNQKVYGKITAPAYPLKNITSRHIALMYGADDWLATPDDVSYLKRTLKVPVMEDYLVPYEKWTHLDFLWGKYTGKYLNPKIIEVLRRTAGCAKVRRAPPHKRRRPHESFTHRNEE